MGIQPSPWSSLANNHSTLHHFGCLMQVKHSRYMPDSGHLKCIKYDVYRSYPWSPPQSWRVNDFLSVTRINFVASLFLLSVRELPLHIPKVSNFLLLSFQITWKSESITLMTSSHSVYTRMYAGACLKNTNSYSRSWCASEFWWTTTRLTWSVQLSGILVFPQALLSFWVVTALWPTCIFSYLYGNLLTVVL